MILATGATGTVGRLPVDEPHTRAGSTSPTGRPVLTYAEWVPAHADTFQKETR